MSEELGNLYKGQFFSFSSEITVSCGDVTAGHPVGSVGVSQNELCVCVCVCYRALLLLWLICPEASDRLCLTHTQTHTCMGAWPVSIQATGPQPWIIEPAASAPAFAAETAGVKGHIYVSLFNYSWNFSRNRLQVVWIVQNKVPWSHVMSSTGNPCI